MGILYVVATPIGNIKDITIRALDVLKAADAVFAEDTRVTRKLLFYHGISKLVRRYDEHVAGRVQEEIKNRLEGGEKLALITDAGTPNISDPGSGLVRFIQENFPPLVVIPIPGPSALTAALSVAGVSANQFTFLGYPPHKKGRQKFFDGLSNIKIKPLVLYESPYRLQKTLASLKNILGGDAEIVVAKELTKIHEEIFRNKIEDAIRYFRGDKIKGEFVVIVP